MTRKRSLKRWKVVVWEKLSKLVRLRTGGRCMRCRKLKNIQNLQGHHLVPRSHGNYATFCEDNIVALCYYCHYCWWHGDSTWDEQQALIKKWIGLDRYWEIKKASAFPAKYSADDYARMYENFTEQIAKIERGENV